MRYWRSCILAWAAFASALLAAPRPLRAQGIAGRVTDDRTQQPAVDFVVRLVQASDTGLAVLDETTTDPKGQFTVVAPGAGRYVLSFGRSASRVHRVAIDVEASTVPAPKDFPLPIQAESDTRPYVDVDVDSMPYIDERVSALTYPTGRRQAGAGGSLFAVFVIDTAGRVERPSMRLFSGTHADFPAAADAWLPTARFRQARVGGVAVRRQVCLPIVFTVDEASSASSSSRRPAVPQVGLAVSTRALCTRALESQSILMVTGQR